MDQGRQDRIGVGITGRMTVVAVAARIHVDNLTDPTRARNLNQPLMVLRKTKHMARQNKGCRSLRGIRRRAAAVADSATGFSSNAHKFRPSARTQISTCEAAVVAIMTASASISSIIRNGSVPQLALLKRERICSRASRFVSATPTTSTSARGTSFSRCWRPKAPAPATSMRTGAEGAGMTESLRCRCKKNAVGARHIGLRAAPRSTSFHGAHAAKVPASAARNELNAGHYQRIQVCSYRFAASLLASCFDLWNIDKMQQMSGRDSMIYEICVDSVAGVRAANAAGADRVELCVDLLEGGITPSCGMIRQARAILGIRLHVIIRPRGGDFLFDDDEFAIMRSDVEAAKVEGAEGVVIGLLTPAGEVDVERTRELISLARPLSVTFHRAFDMTSRSVPSARDANRARC